MSGNTSGRFCNKSDALHSPSETLARDDIGHFVQPPSQEQPHIVDDERHDEVLVFDDITADMGRDEYVRQRPERAFGRQRLGLENVEGGAGDTPLAQCRDERRLIDGLTAAGANVVGAGLHRVEQGSVEQREIFRRRGKNIDQVVGLACRLAQPFARQDLVEAAHEARHAAHPDHAHAESLQHFPDRGADDTGAGDHCGLAVERRPQPALPDVLLMIFHLAFGVVTDRQHQVEDMLAHRHAVNAAATRNENISP